MDSKELMRVVQLPILDEQFQALGEEIARKTADALAIPCTEETVKEVKKVRAELNKQFQELEERRKAIKTVVLKPYNDFEEKYKEYVSGTYKSTDLALKARIDDVENQLKQQCENELREYFDELCVAYHIEWLQYNQLGLKIDMATAKSKNRSKARQGLKDCIEYVCKDLELISGMENEAEIIAEYKETLNFAESVCTVRKRHERIKQAEEEQEKRSNQVQSDRKNAKKVEALAPPTVLEEKLTVPFKVTDTKERLISLKNWMDANGYEYE